MKYLEYYFTISFQWKHNWFSEHGLLSPVIRATIERQRSYGWVDYSILESVFKGVSEMQSTDFVNRKINDIKEVLKGNNLEVKIFNALVGLIVKPDFRPCW